MEWTETVQVRAVSPQPDAFGFDQPLQRDFAFQSLELRFRDACHLFVLASFRKKLSRVNIRFASLC